MSFKLKESPLKGAFSLEGAANEDADFLPILKAAAPGAYTLDLASLSSMNSKGVKQWILFTSTAGTANVRLKNLPPFMVMYANQIKGFLPVNVVVESLFVPYFASTSENQELLLFSRGTHFDEKAIYLPAVMRSPLTNEVLEIDVRPETYFRFLALPIVSK